MNIITKLERNIGTSDAGKNTDMYMIELTMVIFLLSAAFAIVSRSSGSCLTKSATSQPNENASIGNIRPAKKNCNNK